MDSGGGNFSGLIPAGPSAWCREFLGWSNVKNLDSYQGLSKIPLVLNSDIFKLDIDRNEYLLMEYREIIRSFQDTNQSLTDSRTLAEKKNDIFELTLKQKLIIHQKPLVWQVNNTKE